MGTVDSWRHAAQHLLAALRGHARPRVEPALHAFLEALVGFDSVDDESKPEAHFAAFASLPAPRSGDAQNPPCARARSARFPPRRARLSRARALSAAFPTFRRVLAVLHARQHRDAQRAAARARPLDVRVPAALRRGGRHGAPHRGFARVLAQDQPRHPAQEPPRAAVPLLPRPGRHRHVTAVEQQALPRLFALAVPKGERVRRDARARLFGGRV